MTTPKFFLKDLGSSWQIYMSVGDKRQIPFCEHVHHIYPGKVDVFNPCPLCLEEHGPIINYVYDEHVNGTTPNHGPTSRNVSLSQTSSNHPHSSKTLPTPSRNINPLPSVKRNKELRNTILSSPNFRREGGGKAHDYNHGYNCIFEAYIEETNHGFKMTIEPYRFYLSNLSDKFVIIDNALHYPYVPEEVEIPRSWRKWTSNFNYNPDLDYISPNPSCHDDVFKIIKIDKTTIDEMSPNYDYCDMRDCPVDVFISLLSLGEVENVFLVRNRFVNRTIFLINPHHLDRVKLFNNYNDVLEEIEEGTGRKKVKVRRVRGINGGLDAKFQNFFDNGRKGLDYGSNNNNNNSSNNVWNNSNNVNDYDCERVFTFYLVPPYTSGIHDNEGIQTDQLPPILRDRNIDMNKLLQSFLYVVYYLRTEGSMDIHGRGKYVLNGKRRYILPNYYPNCNLLKLLYEEIMENWIHSHEDLSDVIKYAYTTTSTLGRPPYNDVNLRDIEVTLRNDFYCLMSNGVREGSCYPYLKFQTTREVVMNISQFIYCFFTGRGRDECRKDRFFGEDVLYVLSQDNVFMPKFIRNGFDVNAVNFVTNDEDKICYMKYLLQKVAEVKRLRNYSFDFGKEVRDIDLGSFSERDRFYLNNHWL